MRVLLFFQGCSLVNVRNVFRRFSFSLCTLVNETNNGSHSIFSIKVAPWVYQRSLAARKLLSFCLASLPQSLLFLSSPELQLPDQVTTFHRSDTFSGFWVHWQNVQSVDKPGYSACRSRWAVLVFLQSRSPLLLAYCSVSDGLSFAAQRTTVHFFVFIKRNLIAYMMLSCFKKPQYEKRRFKSIMEGL